MRMRRIEQERAVCCGLFFYRPLISHCNAGFNRLSILGNEVRVFCHTRLNRTVKGAAYTIGEHLYETR